MIRGKKGGGWLVFFVNHILSMLLIILAILFLGTALKNIGPATVNNDISDLRYNLLAARMLNSADCLAYEETYSLLEFENPPTYKQYKRVRAGIIDFNKVNDLDKKWSDCIGGTPASLILRDAKTGELLVEKANWADDPIPNTRDVYFVKIYRSDLSPPGFYDDGIITIDLKV